MSTEQQTEQAPRVERVRELSGWQGQALLVKRGDEFFVVSSVNAYSGPETLVFPADQNGEVSSWGEVAGGRGMSRGAAIRELEEQS